MSERFIFIEKRIGIVKIFIGWGKCRLTNLPLKWTWVSQQSFTFLMLNALLSPNVQMYSQTKFVLHKLLYGLVYGTLISDGGREVPNSNPRMLMN